MHFPLTSWSLFFHSFFAPHGALAAYVDRRNEAPAKEMQPRFRHEAEPIEREAQNVPRMAQAAGPAVPVPTSTNEILIYITPSPFAQPVPVSSQSQPVQSFEPQVTFCGMPPLTLIAGTWVNTATTGPYLNTSRATQTATNVCQTSYNPTMTTVCATTLTALASKVTITACEQNVTFSSQFGYTIETPPPVTITSGVVSTPTPTVRDLTTYYVASWQDLAATPGVAPQDVDVKICSTYANGSSICEVEYQEWRVVVVTLTTTTTSAVDVTATYPGPGEIMVHTQHWTVTDTVTTFSLSSTFDVETSIETESTSTGLRVANTPSIWTSTMTVMYNTDSAEPTWTTTAFLTETLYEGTSTAVINPSP